jgi:hypothetical protein
MLLGEVLTLTSLEEEALVLEDLDQAEDLARKRSELLTRAWEERDGYDRDLLRNTLLIIEAMQSRLTDIARDIQRDLGAKLRQTRKQGRYFAENRSRALQGKMSIYCDRLS